MQYVMDVSMGFWETALEMAPYLLLGFLVAGLLSVVISAEKVQKHLGGHGIWPIIKASLLGVPLPLCSCGVIPVAASLRRHGANKGAMTAFLLSTPQTGIDSIMVTLSLLGPVFAVFRPIAAFIAGVVGGVAVEAVDRGKNGDHGIPEQCTDECCAPEGKKSRLARVFHHGFVVLPRDIAKPLFTGLIIAGVISAFVPESFFSDVLGTGIPAMLVMMALGIPVYVCATASVPIALAMWMKGATPGAALVFLMTGPATNAATITTIWKMMGKRAAITYLVVVAATALASGLLLDYVFDLAQTPAGGVSLWMLPLWFKIAAAAALFAVLAAAMLRKRKKPKKKHSNPDCCEKEQHSCCEK
jgi:uncharacterized membrane protein YraQ (UPF0718 family)